MTPGKKYLFRYRTPLQRTDRYGVAVLLEERPDMLVVSGRPVFGTSLVPRAWILDQIQVGDNEKCYWDEKARKA